MLYKRARAESATEVEMIAKRPDREDRDAGEIPVWPLSEWEVKELRKLLESDRRVRWFWSSMRIWSMWVLGILTAIYMLREWISKAFKAIGP